MFWRLLRRKAWLSPPLLVGAPSDWSASELDFVSKAIRSHGQPESSGFRLLAQDALQAMASGDAIEMVARTMEARMNPGMDPERPVAGSHYMRGMPHWCVWIEYAKPAVEAIIGRARKPNTGL